MIRVTRGIFGPRLAVCVACLACALAACTITAASAGAHATSESEQTMRHQLAAGEIKSASFRAKTHSLHLVLKDGQHVSVHLSGPPTAKLRGELNKKGAKVAKKSPPHKLRYIVAGAAVVVLILIVGALLVWRRRRRAALDEY